MADLVNVVFPDGRRGTIPADQLDEAMKHGFRPEAFEESQDRYLEQKYGDSPITAGLEGVARGATFGLSDVILPELGVDQEGLRERKQRNQGAALVGELAPMVAGVGAAGLVSKAGAAAAKAAGGTGLVEGLLGGGTLARAAGAGIKAGAGAAAEGALYGAQQTVSEVALSEDPMSAEAIASALGSNVLYGGLTAGAVGAGLGSLGSITRAAAVRAKNSFQRTLAEQTKALDNSPELLARDAVALREQARGALKDLHVDLKKAGEADKGIAKSVYKAEQSWERVMNSVPENPRVGIGVLRDIEQRVAKARSVLPGEEFAKLDDLVGAAKGFRERLSSLAAEPSMGAQLATAAKDKLLGYAGATLGGIVGGGLPGTLIGGAVGLGFGQLRKRLGSSAAEFGAKLSAGVDTALAVADKAAPALARKIAVGTSFGLNAIEGKQDLEARAREVIEVTANLDAARTQVHDGLAGVRMVDTKLADQLEQQATKRLEYLADKAPKSPGFGSLGRERWQPSDADLAKFARVVAATEQPLRLLDALASDSLTPDVVDAVKNVYPELFKRIGVELMDRMVQPNAKPLPYARRVGISMVLGMPIDSTMRPDFVKNMQATYQAQIDLREENKRKPNMSQGATATSIRGTEPTFAQRMGQ